MTRKQTSHRAGVALVLAAFALPALAVLADGPGPGSEAGAVQAPWLSASQMVLMHLPNVLLALTAMIVALSGIRLVLAAFAAPIDDAAAEGFALRWQIGGFGTPERGWRLTAPLVRLLAGMGLVALGVALAMALMPLDEATHVRQAAKQPAAEAQAGALTNAPSGAASHP